jgi:RND superfamily putative drug exporter
VLVVVFLVVALLLRALIAPLVLVATTALSFGASLGLANLLWRYGLGYPGIEAQLPLYIFVFLVSLGVDYNIFLAARIREEASQAAIRQATIRGLAATGSVTASGGRRAPPSGSDQARAAPGHPRSRHWAVSASER